MTKDEFISKYHTQKVLKFEPPTWEEFLETATDERWAYWVCNNVMITMKEENEAPGIFHTENVFCVQDDYDKRETIKYVNMSELDNREEMYYKALDIAKKWFLGEE